MPPAAVYFISPQAIFMGLFVVILHLDEAAGILPFTPLHINPNVLPIAARTKPEAIGHKLHKPKFF